MRTYDVPRERVVNTINTVSEFMKFIFLGKVDLPRQTSKIFSCLDIVEISKIFYWIGKYNEKTKSIA